VIDEALRRGLLALARRDLETRDRLAAAGTLFDAYHPEMQAVHEANAAALLVFVEAQGWPGRPLVGDDGAEAAWLIAQHAIGLPPFQRACLRYLEAAAEAGEVPAWQPAYLVDRILSLEGRKQVYGTQFDWDGKGEMSPLPIEDAAAVDALRSAVGLPPLAEAILVQRASANRDNRPADLAEHRRRMRAWARLVGWR
jgi:hypothetical protein